MVFRDPQILLDHQISNPNFKSHIDYSPRLVFGEQGQHVWSDFMTGNWAWSQCVSTSYTFLLVTETDSNEYYLLLLLLKNELFKDPDNHGAMFVPIILGSDKTTVSVAAGNNEYYPIYISTGNVCNGSVFLFLSNQQLDHILSYRM